MSVITVDRECGCFRRSSLNNNVQLDSKDDAMIEAQRMVTHMNEKFCSKHSFTLSEDGTNFSITMDMPQPAASGGCCGGGHCS